MYNEVEEGLGHIGKRRTTNIDHRPSPLRDQWRCDDLQSYELIRILVYHLTNCVASSSWSSYHADIIYLEASSCLHFLVFRIIQVSLVRLQSVHLATMHNNSKYGKNAQRTQP